ncbi:MAG: hypothetical protein K0Q51_163 [Rickettsiaceae bacterium]|nr:hypothetical protein [Rickettsiaceae bacterium]
MHIKEQAKVFQNILPGIASHVRYDVIRNYLIAITTPKPKDYAKLIGAGDITEFSLK